MTESAVWIRTEMVGQTLMLLGWQQMALMHSLRTALNMPTEMVMVMEILRVDIELIFALISKELRLKMCLDASILMETDGQMLAMRLQRMQLNMLMQTWMATGIQEMETSQTVALVSLVPLQNRNLGAQTLMETDGEITSTSLQMMSDSGLISMEMDILTSKGRI